ncbi:hypothetical protein JCM17380_54730 [Desulfosporosinus burensis]
MIFGGIGTEICAKMSCLGRVTKRHNVTFWHGVLHGKVLGRKGNSSPHFNGEMNYPLYYTYG